MRDSFDPNSHKNLELFRYYLNRDLSRIEENIQNNKNMLLSYFIASLVDMSIVVVFNEVLSGKSVWCKLFAVFFLIVLFILISTITKIIMKELESRRKGSGKEEYMVEASRQKVIDDFDNIACDALLICEDYMHRYNLAEEDYLKNFYLYEIIHHLTKSIDLFNEVYENKELYISSSNPELIDTYRIANYIDFAKKINDFLSKNISNSVKDVDLKKDLDNLNEAISKFANT